MPTYSYRCTVCDTAFDIHQEFTDDSLTVCPNCGGKLRKVYGTVGVTFTGSGFYRTDSRPAEKKESSSDSGSTSSTTSTPSAPASSPSTPAASSASTPAKKPATKKE